MSNVTFDYCDEPNRFNWSVLQANSGTVPSNKEHISDGIPILESHATPDERRSSLGSPVLYVYCNKIWAQKSLTNCGWEPADCIQDTSGENCIPGDIFWTKDYAHMLSKKSNLMSEATKAQLQRNVMHLNAMSYFLVRKKTEGAWGGGGGGG
jgi:hypothetical protein